MISKDIAKRPISILKNTTISDALKKLLENNISRLVIIENRQPVGIVTEKDLGLFLFNESTKTSLDKISLAKIMHQIEFIEGSEAIEKCAKVMIEKKISSLGIGNQSKLEGIITKTDLVKYFSEKHKNKFKVVDYMTHDYISTHSATPLYKVIKKMLEHKISRIITKNQNEEPQGVISFRDLFKIALELGDEEDDTGFTLSEKIRNGFLSEEGFGGVSLARDVLTKGIISTKFNEDLAEASKLILKNKISGIAVLDGNQSLAGILSKTDITRALTNV